MFSAADCTFANAICVYDYQETQITLNFTQLVEYSEDEVLSFRRTFRNVLIIPVHILFYSALFSMSQISSVSASICFISMCWISFVTDRQIGRQETASSKHAHTKQMKESRLDQIESLGLFETASFPTTRTNSDVI